MKKKNTIEIFIKDLSKQEHFISEFDEILWYSLLDKIRIYSDDVQFIFKDGRIVK